MTEHFADVLYRSVTTPVLICDRDHVVSCAGVSKKDFLEKRISSELESIMESRQLYTGDRDRQMYPIEGIDYGASIAMPIIGNGDILGAVVFLWSDGSRISPTETKLAQQRRLSASKWSNNLGDIARFDCAVLSPKTCLNRLVSGTF